MIGGEAALERIVINRGHFAVPINHENPLYIKYLEQIRVDKSPKAIVIDPDLLWVPSRPAC